MINLHDSRSKGGRRLVYEFTVIIIYNDYSNTYRFCQIHTYVNIYIIQGNWRLGGDAFPSIQQLIINQHRSGQAVTNRSQAILKTPILREEWELKNDDIELGEKIGHVSTHIPYDQTKV